MNILNYPVATSSASSNGIILMPINRDLTEYKEYIT